MKWTRASVAASSIMLVAAASLYAGDGPYAGILDRSGNAGCCGTNCTYGYSLWEGFCSGADCAGGCAGGGGCGGCGLACQPGSFGGGWWYGGGPGCGLGCLRGMFGGGGNACGGCGSCPYAGCGGGLGGCGGGLGGCGGGLGGCGGGFGGCSGGFGGCSGGLGGCGGGFGGSGGGLGCQLRGLAERFRCRMACSSWNGGGPLDSYGLTDGACNSGYNYNYINQWNSGMYPANAVQQPMNTAVDEQSQMAPSNAGETLYDSSQLGEEIPDSSEM